MSSHLSRKELKQDAIATELEHGVEYVASHKTLVTRIGIAVVAVLVIYGGYMLYSNRKATEREEALRDARRVLNASVGAEAKPPAKSYPTEAEKQKAVVEAFTAVADKYPGSTEAAISLSYVAGVRIDEGDMDAAAAVYRQMIDSSPSEFAATAKLALGQILWSQGKHDEAKAMLQQVIDHPTIFASAAQAKLTLGRLLLETDEAEARTVLESIDNDATTARSQAIELLGRLNQASSK